MALEDALVLAKCISSELSVESALGRYESVAPAPHRSYSAKIAPDGTYRAVAESRGCFRAPHGDQPSSGGSVRTQSEESLILMRLRRVKVTVAFLAAVAPAVAQDTAIDIQRSTITIHVGKAGLFSAAAHDHTIAAPISSGTIRESGAPRVEFTLETSKMRVQPDPKIDAKTEAEIQMHMEEMTLETKKFPEITFRSTSVNKLADGWKVEGNLSLHGVTKPVSLAVKRAGNAYTAHTVLKQTSFRNQADQRGRRNDQSEGRSGNRFRDRPPPAMTLPTCKSPLECYHHSRCLQAANT